MAEELETVWLLRIGGYDFEVVEDSDLYREGALGEIDTIELRIRVAPNLKGVALARVLWHEALHGVLACAGENDHDERIIDAMAHGIIQVLRDNPWMAGGVVDGV